MSGLLGFSTYASRVHSRTFENGRIVFERPPRLVILFHYYTRYVEISCDSSAVNAL
jgi:hypothetical protein